MCIEADTLCAMLGSNATQVVLIGDHKQLQPVLKNEKAKQLGLAVSMFERYSQKSRMLQIQYRMVRNSSINDNKDDDKNDKDDGDGNDNYNDGDDNDDNDHNDNNGDDNDDDDNDYDYDDNDYGDDNNDDDDDDDDDDDYQS